MRHSGDFSRIKIEDQITIIDMCIFLIEHGARDININGAIRIFVNTGEKGIALIETAIKHGASLRGALKSALNLPQNTPPAYKEKVVEVLLNAGARLDD